MLAAVKVQDVTMRQVFEARVRVAGKLNAKRNRYVHAEYLPVIGPDDTLVKMLHRRLKDSGRSAGGAEKRAIDDLLQPVEEKGLRTLAQDDYGLAYRARVLAEKCADQSY